jgi:hypothetical protein
MRRSIVSGIVLLPSGSCREVLVKLGYRCAPVCRCGGAVVSLVLGVAQQALPQSAKDQLVGTWMLVSIYDERQDGSKFDPFGANPTGILIFDANGRFASQIIGSGLPKFASNNRLEGTPEENKAVVQGSENVDSTLLRRGFGRENRSSLIVQNIPSRF